VPDVFLRGALAGLVILLVGAGPAAAHASLLRSDPADGSSRRSEPTAITLTFNENVATPAYVVVTAPNGAKVAVGKVHAVDRDVTAGVTPAGQRGTYTVAYRVVSADGHPIEDTIRYRVTSGRVVKQVEPPDRSDFLTRHGDHLFWGILAAGAAIALLFAPLRRRDDPDTP
jgi:methionine-rich copper-binding protein CopC